MQLRNGDWVVVCDGGKYIAYQNNGDIDRLDLRVISSSENENPSTEQQGTDRPGRYASPDGQRSAVEETDWHDLSEKRFIEALAQQMTKWAETETTRRYVLVADPRSMGVLRKELKDQTLARIDKTITGDFVHHPLAAVEELINGA